MIKHFCRSAVYQLSANVNLHNFHCFVSIPWLGQSATLAIYSWSHVFIGCVRQFSKINKIEPESPFKILKAVVLTKITRYEFERRRKHKVSENEFKKIVSLNNSYHTNVYKQCLFIVFIFLLYYGHNTSYYNTNCEKFLNLVIVIVLEILITKNHYI